MSDETVPESPVVEPAAPETDVPEVAVDPEDKSDTVENVPSEEVGPAVRWDLIEMEPHQGPENDLEKPGWSSDTRQPISPSEDPAKRLNPTAGDPGFAKWAAESEAVVRPEDSLSGNGVENGDPTSDRPAVQTDPGPRGEVE